MKGIKGFIISLYGVMVIAAKIPLILLLWLNTITIRILIFLIDERQDFNDKTFK